MLPSKSRIENVKMLSLVNAVVFDFDGTIANSFQLFLEIFYNELAKRNQEIKYEELIEKCQQFTTKEIESGYQDPKKLLIKTFYNVCRQYDFSKSKSAYITLTSALRIQKNYSEIEIFNQAYELLDFLHNEGIPSILITMSSKKNVREILRNNNLDRYFQIILDKKDLKRDLSINSSFDKSLGIRQALNAFGLEDEDLKNTIVIGDLPWDITDGKTVGAKTAAVTTGPVPREILAGEDPDFIFTDLSDFLLFLNVK